MPATLRCVHDCFSLPAWCEFDPIDQGNHGPAVGGRISGYRGDDVLRMFIPQRAVAVQLRLDRGIGSRTDERPDLRPQVRHVLDGPAVEGDRCQVAGGVGSRRICTAGNWWKSAGPVLVAAADASLSASAADESIRHAAKIRVVSTPPSASRGSQRPSSERSWAVAARVHHRRWFGVNFMVSSPRNWLAARTA